MKKIGILLILSLFLIGCATNSSADNTEQEVDKPAETKVDDSRVVTIGDKTFDDDDLAFHSLMNQLTLTLQMDETEDKDETVYLEEQKEYYENVNVNLQKMIELYAAALLAEEKDYFVPDEDLMQEVKEYKEEVAGVTEAQELVDEFEQEKFNRYIEEYVRQTILRDRVTDDLKEDVIEDNPEAEDDEINYLLDEKFEDLMIDQVYSLDMDIHLE